MSPRLSLDPVAERVEEDEHVNLQGGGEQQTESPICFIVWCERLDKTATHKDISVPLVLVSPVVFDSDYALPVGANVICHRRP
jgi:hypothetical protein